MANYAVFSRLILSLTIMFWFGLLQAGVTPVGDMTHEKDAKAGERYRQVIVVQNTDSQPAEVKLYQTDYSFAADGSTHYDPPGNMPRSNAKWVGLSRDLIKVPANATERIEYEVRVPAEKGLTGTYWSMIMVEPITKGSRESAEALPDNTTAISQVLRYGIQVVTNIGKGGQTELTFANPRLVQEEGKRFFTIDVANTGQRSLRPALWLELYSDKGSPVGKFQGEARRLYPGTSSAYKIDLGQTPNGKYLGMVAADGTGDNLFGANVELEIK